MTENYLQAVQFLRHAEGGHRRAEGSDEAEDEYSSGLVPPRPEAPLLTRPILEYYNFAWVAISYLAPLDPNSKARSAIANFYYIVVIPRIRLFNSHPGISI